MNLKYARIKNFRSCEDVELHLGPMHTLVGANNAGKSTILRALDFFFNPSISKINRETFWNNDTSLTIRVEALFDHLTPEEIDKLRGYLRPDNSFHAARSARMGLPEGEPENETSPEEGKIAIGQHFSKPVPIFDWLDPSCVGTTSIDNWWKQKEQLTAHGVSFAEFVGNTKPNVTTWKDKAGEFARQHLEVSDYGESWTDNPRGYSGVLKATLPHFILVPAVRDVSDEAKVTKTNPLGQLLYAVISSVTQEQKDALDQSLREMRKMLNKEGGQERLQTVLETERRLNEVLNEYMDCDLEIEFQPPTLETILTVPKIYVDDGFRNVVENKGHGLQRAVIFSIIRCYSELVTGRGNAKKRSMIFAVEEPELYMHPQAQRTIRRVFKNISGNHDQVIFSTHSALLLDVSEFDQIIRVEATQRIINGHKTIESRVWQLPMSAMIQDLRTRHPGVTATEKSIRELYANAYHPMRAEGFFAKKIILVEGATEQYCLPIYAEAANLHFDNLNVSVVDCGGKGCMDRLYRVFNELHIPCYMLFDYDKQSGDSNILAKSRELLQLFDQPGGPPSSVLITECVACFPNKWETDLASEIAGLPELTAEARGKLGLGDDSGKPLVARYVAKTLTSRTPPQIPPTVKAIIEKAVGVSWAKSCLADCESNV